MLFKTIVFIPAREGSKRIRNKNIISLGGKPLIEYSIRIGLELDYPVYVSTDSKLIAQISQDLGAKVINRPVELSQDNSAMIDCMAHALKTLQMENGKIIFFRPTTPFRDIKIIKSGIESFKDNNSSLRSIEPLSEAVEKLVYIKDGYVKSINSKIDLTVFPNQSFDKSYRTNGYLDILRPYFILDCKDLYGYTCQPFITPFTPEIDTYEDLAYAEYYGQKNNLFKR